MIHKCEGIAGGAGTALGSYFKGGSGKGGN